MMREREAIREHLNDFFGIVIDAHILETFQNATSGFIVSNNLNYVIDPVTYKFSLDPIEDCVSKRWYDRLVKNYNMEDLNPPGERMNLSALNNLDKAKSFAKSVLEYEAKRVPYLSEETVALLSLFEESLPEARPPYCLIPPYFVIDSSNILDLNVRLVEVTYNLTNEKLFAYIPLDNDFLYASAQSIDRIISRYSDLEVDGYFVWVTDFNEVKERRFSLDRFKAFLDSLKSQVGNREVINMFGGFFSMILTTQNIDGLVHGVGISESRDPYMLGGPAPTRYYVPVLHRMLSLERAQDLSENISLRCDCPVCRDTSPSDMSVNQLIQHFLNVRVAERNRVESLSLDEIIRMLERDRRRVISSVRDPEIKKQCRAYTVHLSEWINALRSARASD